MYVCICIVAKTTQKMTSGMGAKPSSEAGAHAKHLAQTLRDPQAYEEAYEERSLKLSLKVRGQSKSWGGGWSFGAQPKDKFPKRPDTKHTPESQVTGTKCGLWAVEPVLPGDPPPQVPQPQVPQGTQAHDVPRRARAVHTETSGGVRVTRRNPWECIHTYIYIYMSAKPGSMEGGGVP